MISRHLEYWTWDNLEYFLFGRCHVDDESRASNHNDGRAMRLKIADGRQKPQEPIRSERIESEDWMGTHATAILK